MATSVIDYIFRELAVNYMGRFDLAHVEPEEIKGKASAGIVKSLDAVEPEFVDEEIVSERVVELDKEKVKTYNYNLATINSSNQQSIVESEKVIMSNEIKKARQKGYTGDICIECQSMTMVRNGTCLKCVTCGSTSGCS